MPTSVHRQIIPDSDLRSFRRAWVQIDGRHGIQVQDFSDVLEGIESRSFECPS